MDFMGGEDAAEAIADEKSAHTRTLAEIDKAIIIDSAGRTLKEFKRSLTPRWVALWCAILSGHFILLATVLGIIKLESITILLPLTILLGAFIIGYTQAYIQLFFHEAAHGNIAKNRQWNDWLANLFIGVFIGQDIKTYRPIHFKHHQKLGTPEDSERTYFDALNAQFIFESLTGIKIAKVLLGRKELPQLVVSNNVSAKKKNFVHQQLILGLLLHLGILTVAIIYGHWPLALAWVIGMGLVLPFFLAIRQLLEHRDIEAKSQVDYRIIPHGSTHRLFGNSFLARTLGGAGFNRHLLHHWEPQISCTQLRAFENFLLQTQVADIIRNHQTTYLATFMQLMRSP